MERIVVVGGGFGGVWSAASAARVREDAGRTADDLEIVMVEPQDQMVIRPRLYERRPAEKAVDLVRILEPIGVEHVRGAVTQIDCDAAEVVVQTSGGPSQTLAYDRLILAAGSRLVAPDLPGAELIHDVDAMPGAIRLDRHLADLSRHPDREGRHTAVVVGSGFTGLEVATELVGRLREVAALDEDPAEVRVVLVELARVVGPDLGPGPRPVIESALEQLGVERRHGVTVDAVDALGARLSDGTYVPAATVVWTAGMRASTLTEQIPGERDRLGRLDVDATLRVRGVARVFAAGDTAAVLVEEGHAAMQSCQHAHAMGRVAGTNAAADLVGADLVAFAPDPYVTCLDLGDAGAVFTTGWTREVASTGEAAKRTKRTINRAIYPPTDDRDRILAAADPGAATRTPTRADVATAAGRGAE